MAAVSGGSNPEEGDRAEQEAPPNVMRQPKSRDPTSEIKVHGVAMLPEDTFDVEGLEETVSLEDTSRSVPPAEEPVLRAVRIGVVGATAGSLELERKDFELLEASQAVLPEDTFGSVPPAEELILGVVRIDEVGAASGS